MLCGIYALYWEKPDLIYIGQSIDIDRRRRSHFNDLLKCKHRNKYVQNAYNEHGLPEFIIIQECSSDQLDTCEKFWINEYDSITNGLNICEAGKSGRGINNGNSKYTKQQLVMVFKLLSRSNYIGYNEIVDRTEVSLHMVSDIALGRAHVWLQEKYPFLFLKISKRKDTFSRERQRYPIKTAILININTNEEVKVINKKDFARSIDVSLSGLYNLFNGRLKTLKGWKLKEYK